MTRRRRHAEQRRPDPDDEARCTRKTDVSFPTRDHPPPIDEAPAQGSESPRQRSAGPGESERGRRSTPRLGRSRTSPRGVLLAHADRGLRSSRSRPLLVVLVLVEAARAEPPQPRARVPRSRRRPPDRLGFASVYIARQAADLRGSLGYAGFFFGLYLVAHIGRAPDGARTPTRTCCRWRALLTAIGLTEIYRLGPRDAFKQGLWIVIGVAAFAATLLWLRRDYRVLERYKYLFGVGAIALLFLPRLPVIGDDGQRRAALGPRRRLPVPAGRARQDLPDRLPRRLPAREARGARAGPPEGPAGRCS